MAFHDEFGDAVGFDGPGVGVPSGFAVSGFLVAGDAAIVQAVKCCPNFCDFYVEFVGEFLVGDIAFFFVPYFDEIDCVVAGDVLQEFFGDWQLKKPFLARHKSVWLLLF